MKRSMKKFVSIILSMLMAVAVLPANVMAAVEINPSVADSYIINEDFADSTLDSNITLPASGAEVTADGVLKLTSGSVNFNLDSASNWNTLKCISMKLKKDNLEGIVSVQNPNGYLNAYWHKNNEIKTWKSINVDGINVLETLTASTEDWITLKMLLNPTMEEYLVLIELGDKVYTFTESLPKDKYNAIGNGNQFKISVAAASKGNIYVDDLKVYNADETSVPAETAILWDAAYLNSTLPKTADSSITLPLTGKYGSAISWSSSNIGVIANDGTVTRQAADTDVTLTATVQKAGKNKTQSYTVTVLKNYITPVSGGFGYEENFSNAPSLNSNITLPASGAEITNDGVLKITKTGAAYAGSAVSVGLKVASGANWDTLKCVSMKLKKDDLGAAISVGNPSGFFKVYWHVNNAIKASAADNTAKDFDTITAQANDWVTLKILMNPVLQKYFLQIEEGNKVYTVKEAPYQSKGINGSDTFNITMEMASPAGNIYVDDLKVYDVVETSVPEETAVLWDAAILDSVIPENIEADLSTVGAYGSSISWSSNVSGIVTSDGIIALPTEDKSVAFTATFTNGNAASQSATITRTVKTAEFKFGKLVYSGTGYDNGALKDGAVTVSFPVTKVNATTDGLVVISAAYKTESGNAKLKDVDVCPVSFTEGNAQTATMDLTIEDGCFIKTFIVDSLSTLKPQISPIVIGQ